MQTTMSNSPPSYPSTMHCTRGAVFSRTQRETDGPGTRGRRSAALRARGVTLVLTGRVSLPAHSAGGFDHGDVHPATGRVFVAHTANDTIDVVDGPGSRLERSRAGCGEGSGVLCASGAPQRVFAAARAAGPVRSLR